VAIEVTLLVLYTAIVVRLGRSLRGAALRDEVLFAQLFFSAYIVAFVVLRLPSIARRSGCGPTSAGHGTRGGE